MKLFFGFCIGVVLGTLFVQVLIYGAEKEARRQCIVAMDHCEQYGEYGACEPKYLKVCEGINL